MTLFISLVIFAISLYLFIMTNYKIRTIKENIIIDDLKREMESLITEFNGAAARNIELMEDKISSLQDMIRKATDKMVQMDEKVGRINRPIVVEKFIEKNRDENLLFVKEEIGNKEETKTRSRKVKKNTPVIENRDNFIENSIIANSDVEKELNENDSFKKQKVQEMKPEIIQDIIQNPEIEKVNEEYKPEEDLKKPESRSDKLKYLIKSGKKKEELIEMGYIENEINLMNFLINRK